MDEIAVATTAAGAGVIFSREERERHVYIVGKSGVGKSTLLFNLALGDIHAGEGIAVIDPHGDLALDIIDCIPSSRINDVCYLDAAETERPVGFNPATRIAPERRALAAAGMVSAFKHLWHDSWGPRLEHFLYHGIAALIARQHATLLDLPRIYTDDRFREHIGNAGTLVVFRVGSRDAELLAPEFRPMDAGGLADQEPFTAWLRRGVGRDRIFVEPKLYKPLGTAAAVREQSSQRFGRPRATIERQGQMQF